VLLGLREDILDGLKEGLFDGLFEGILVLDNDGQTVVGTAVLGATVGSVLGSVVIDDDLILFVSFNSSNRLA